MLAEMSVMVCLAPMPYLLGPLLQAVLETRIADRPAAAAAVVAVWALSWVLLAEFQRWVRRSLAAAGLMSSAEFRAGLSPERRARLSGLKWRFRAAAVLLLVPGVAAGAAAREALLGVVLALIGFAAAGEWFRRRCVSLGLVLVPVSRERVNPTPPTPPPSRGPDLLGPVVFRPVQPARPD